MFKFFIKTVKHLKVNFVTNTFLVVGFSIGMSIGLLSLFIWDSQKKIDSSIEEKANLYRVNTSLNGYWKLATSPIGLLEDGIYLAGVNVFQLIPFGNQYVQLDDNLDPLRVKSAVFSQGFINRFNFEVIGDDKFNYTSPDEILITRRLADKLSKTEGVKLIGEVLSINGLGKFTIRGIINDTNKYHFYFDIYMPEVALRALMNKNIINAEDYKSRDYTKGYNYFEINSDNESNIEEELQKLSISYLKLINNDQLTELNLTLQHVSEILSEDLVYDTDVVLELPDFQTFLIIAVVIFIVSAINYFNIQVYNLFKRMKEFGIRKIHGASNKQVFVHIISENIILSFISLCISLVIIRYLPIKNVDEILFGINLNVKLIVLVIIFALIVGVLTSFLPAFLISKKNAIYLLNEEFLQKRKRKFSVSDILVTIQFILVILFIHNYILVEKQTSLLLNTDYGYDVSSILTVQLKTGNDSEILRTNLLSDPKIESVCFTSRLFGSSPNQTHFFNDKREKIFIDYYSSDSSFFRIFDLKLIQGDSKQLQKGENELGVVINEVAMNLFFGKNENVIGRFISLEDSIDLKISGVVEDFNYSNLKHEIGPLVIRNVPKEYDYLHIKVNEVENLLTFKHYLEQNLTHINVEYESVEPYMDILNTRMGHPEDRASLGIISLFIVIITCLGLIGTTLINAEKIKKSIAIHKLFGASRVGILIKLLRQYLIILFISFLIAIPIGTFIGEEFLNDFIKRISIDLIHYLQIILICSALVILTVSTQVVSYSKLNILKGLKRE